MDKVKIGNATLYNGDCLQVMEELKGVNMVLTDPPYYQVKGDFDFNFDSFDDFQKLIDDCGKLWKKLLPKNGSLYVFGHAKTIAYTQILLDKYFNLENNLVWDVFDRQTKKGVTNFRCYAPVTERCLFYSNEVERTGLEEIKLDINNFKELRNYFKALQAYIGLGSSSICKELGNTKADHAFRWNSTQWDMPTKETYEEIRAVFSTSKWKDWKQYEELRKQYEELRKQYEELRRPFNNSLKLTDIIEHSQDGHITGKYDHETIKPVGLMEKFIITSSNKGDVILDSFMGTGTTGIAALKHGRKFIGVEKDKKYFDIACERIAQENMQVSLF